MVDTAQVARQSEQDAAGTRMKIMVDRLRDTELPPWRTQNEVTLEDGAFPRAMRLVPKDEGQAYWTEFDAPMQRLYDIWAKQT